MKEWVDFANRVNNGINEVEIAIIGKYTHLKDSYISHEETLRYAGALTDCKVKIRWVEAGIYAENIASEKAFLSAGYKWIYDIPDKYLFEGSPTKVKIFAARNSETR